MRGLRVYHDLKANCSRLGRANKGLKQTIGTWAKKTGLEHNRNLVNGNSTSSTLSYMIANKVVFQKIKSALGFQKCLRFFVSAAPITIETLEYFMSVDIRWIICLG